MGRSMFSRAHHQLWFPNVLVTVTIIWLKICHTVALLDLQTDLPNVFKFLKRGSKIQGMLQTTMLHQVLKANILFIFETKKSSCVTAVTSLAQLSWEGGGTPSPQPQPEQGWGKGKGLEMTWDHRTGGTSLRKDLGLDARGYPLPPPIHKQTENITFLRTSYAGGNDIIFSSRKLHKL